MVQDVKKALAKVETLNYHEMIELNGMKITCYNAGHVLGAAMFLVPLP